LPRRSQEKTFFILKRIAGITMPFRRLF
jgi:hypothetical protein